MSFRAPSAIRLVPASHETTAPHFIQIDGSHLTFEEGAIPSVPYSLRQHML